MQDENKPQGNSDWLETYGIALVDRVSCDYEDCSNDAEYYSKVSCCGAVLIACRSCMQKAGKVVIWMMHNDRMLTCDGCGQKCRPQGWMSKPEHL